MATYKLFVYNALLKVELMTVFLERHVANTGKLMPILMMKRKEENLKFMYKDP